ncbi:MAG TPA: hypothetical protein VFI31_09275 [Pirellulales bacterium]|nr:hypothetical protein [Pirellulales bacterium]
MPLAQRRFVVLASLYFFVLSTAVAAAEDDRDKKVDRYDRIVDAFIQYDIGQLRGEKGAQANQGFLALQGDDAIPALVRGANKAAHLTQSCPIMVIANKLQQLLSQTSDQGMLRYALQHLDGSKGIYGQYIESLKAQAKQLLRELDGTPEQPSERVLNKGGTAGQLRRSKMPIEKWSKDDLLEAITEEGVGAVQALEELKARKGNEYTAALAEAVTRVNDSLKPIARALLAQRLTRMTDDTLRAMLKGDDREVRAAAAYAVGYKGSPLYHELVETMKDRDATVALNAQQSLIKLSGEDLGPAEGASYAERFAASKRWRLWVEKHIDELHKR